MKAPDFLSKQVDKAAYYYFDLTARADGPLAVVCGGWELCAPDYIINRDGFRYYCIEYVAEGYGELYLRGKQIQLMPGSVLSYGPDVKYRMTNDPDRPMLKYFIDFTGEGSEELLSKAGLDAGGSMLVSEPERVRSILNEIQQCGLDTRPESNKIAVYLLQALVLILDALRTSGNAAQSGAEVSYKRCRNVIDNEFLELNTLADIAKRCNLDPATVCRLFKRFSRESPYRYLMRQKMNFAAVRLQLTSISVNQLAEEMDFCDAFLFSRVFKRIHGLSPRAFRQRATRSSSSD